MKRWLIVMVLFWPVAALCFDTGAFFFRGRYLVDTCQSDVNAKYNECVAYLASVSDTADAIESMTGANAVCVPTGVSLDELRKVFNEYQAQHPELLHGSAATLAINAFKEAWPCPAAPGVTSGGSSSRFPSMQPGFPPVVQ